MIPRPRLIDPNKSPICIEIPKAEPKPKPPRKYNKYYALGCAIAVVLVIALVFF